jgi:hypothetical protein
MASHIQYESAPADLRGSESRGCLDQNIISLGKK